MPDKDPDYELRMGILGIAAIFFALLWLYGLMNPQQPPTSRDTSAASHD